MNKFELWLDESGDFENDSQKTINDAIPSLIGGLLVEANSFPDTYVNYIIPEDGTYHSVNENDQLDRFKLIEEKISQNSKSRLVVFSNQERIMIIDNNLTYLNVITEGILQLIKRLKAQYGEIQLKVIIANRVDTTTGLSPGQSVVQIEEYEKRLKEKLLIASYENSIKENEWKLQTSSARKDKRLMLADIVCNTFFTRGKRRKFSDEEREYIESIYTDEDKSVVFTVFESVLEKQFKNDLLENRIGEAIAGICLSSDSEILDKCFSLLRHKFRTCGLHNIRFQYNFINSYIEYYINVIRDFDLCINFLQNLLNYYVPLLRDSKNNSYADQISLDIKFYMFTVFTHKGDLRESNKLEDECDELINKLPKSFDTLNYRIKFETRKIVNLINAFDFETALKKADEQVKRCNEIKDFLDLISEDNENYYDEFAKALGTRLQIKSFMVRKNESLYESGKKDSEEAIASFTNISDKQRQYLYRTHLETEHGDYKEALRFLKMSAALSSDSELRDLLNEVIQSSVFGVSAYVKLMAEAEDWETSKEMFKVLSNSSYIQGIEKKQKHYHPEQIILWKYAYYCANNDMMNAAIKYYEKAFDSCFLDDDITLKAIGIGIGFEFLAMAIRENRKEVSSLKRQIRKRWEKIKEEDNLGILDSLFGCVDFDQNKYDYYLLLSKNVTY